MEADHGSHEESWANHRLQGLPGQSKITGSAQYNPPADFLSIINGDKNTCTSGSSPSTSLIAGIGLAVSAIAQPAVPTKGMVVTPFEQVKFSYRSDKAARESDCCGRKRPGQR